MKLVIIIAVALVLLAGGGGAGWWFFLREVPAEGATAGAKLPKDPADTQRSLELEPFVLPLLREGRVTEHLTLVLRLEFDGPESSDRVDDLERRLRDAFLSELHGILAFRHVQELGEDKALPVMRERLLVAGNKVFGAGRVKAVLIQAANRRTPGEG